MKLHFVIAQTLQVPTAQQYQDLVTAIYNKDIVDLCYLLSQGLHLTCLTMDGGHTSTLVALAILRDHAFDSYTYEASDGLCSPTWGQPDLFAITSVC